MRLGLILSVARKFMRSNSLARSTAIMFATAAVLVGMFITMKSFTLSSEQVVDRDLGRFSTQADLSTVRSIRPGDTSVTKAAADAAREAGARDLMVSLTSFDVRPSMARPPLTVYVECDWATVPFPNRYQLVEGRWPTQPGDVVLTNTLRSVVGSTDSLSVLSGNEHLRVTGVARDRFEAAPRIMAAEGTWAGFSPATLRRFPTLTAAAALYWNGGEQQRITTAVSDVLRKDQQRVSSADIETRISSNVRTRATELTLVHRSWIERLPIAYQIPSLALPLLSVLTIFGLNSRRFRKSMTVLRSIGMSTLHATAGVAAATTAWTIISTVLGMLAGVCLGILARPICDRFLPGPISPSPALAPPLARLLIVTVVSCLFAATVLHLAGRRPATAPPTLPTRTPSQQRGTNTTRAVRRLVATAAGCAAIIQVASLNTVPKAMILAGTLGITVLLFTPELVGTAIRLLPTADPRVRLGRQQLINDQERAVVAVAILTAVLGGPLGMLTLLATLIDTAERDVTPMVASHQVVLSSPAGHLHAPSPEVVKAVTSRVAFETPPIQIGYLWTDKAKVTVQDGGKGTVLVVDSVDEVTRLNKGPLTAAQAQTLQRGGMLVWDAGVEQRVLIHTDLTTRRVVSTTEPVRAIRADFEPSWKTSVSALLLTATAQRLDLPIARAAIVFTDVSDSQAASAKQAVLDAGLDPAQVGIYQPPDPIRVPPPYYGAVLGLGLIILVTTMVVARTQVITLRSYLGRLVAVGLSTRWVRHVLLLQSAVVILLSTVLSLIIAIPPVIVAALRMQGFTLSIPWAWLGLTIATFYTATIAATMLSSQRLRSTDRSAV